MKVDKAGYDFLADREGIRLQAYLDTGGVPTIGIGSIEMFGKPVKMGMTCTKEQAYDQCALDVQEDETAINNLVKVPLTQNQFNALASFIYNVGVKAFATSTMLKKLNMKDYRGAADQFDRWIYDNGRIVEGIVHRRTFEKNLFLK